jgi:hypothetical protein
LSLFVALFQGKNLGAWTFDDVYHWIYSFGENYAIYAESFKKKKIDGFGLYTYVRNETLTDLGVTNEDHRRKILDGIQQLKKDRLNKHRYNLNT